MKSILLMASTVALLSVFIFSLHKFYSSAPARTADKVVAVEGGSGVIIYSEKGFSLILTSYHVIMDNIDAEGAYLSDAEPITVRFDMGPFDIFYAVYDVEVDEENDLALLLISPGFELNYADTPWLEPKLAEDIHLIGNPNNNYRTLTKGVVSNKHRQFGEAAVWQVSGGLIFGSSGGGAFNMDGELIGIARSIDLIITDMCDIEEEIPGENEEAMRISRCYGDPISYIGFIVPFPQINDFLRSTDYVDIF